MGAFARPLRRLVVASLYLVVASTLGSCGYWSEKTDARGGVTPADRGPFLIGQVTADRIDAHARPRGNSPVLESFGKTNAQGAPQVFLLDPEETDDRGLLPRGTRWVRALLPIRPNGTTGYLRVDQLELMTTPYRIEVQIETYELTLFHGTRPLFRAPVGIGTGATPTPTGRFYLASLLKPPDQGSIYGSYAYGLSGYSETLLDWADGGIVGLHGTNDPDSIGRRASHGCIRMHNRDIERLVPFLPLGTPIEIA